MKILVLFAALNLSFAQIQDTSDKDGKTLYTDQVDFMSGLQDVMTPFGLIMSLFGLWGSFAATGGIATNAKKARVASSARLVASLTEAVLTGTQTIYLSKQLTSVSSRLEKMCCVACSTLNDSKWDDFKKDTNDRCRCRSSHGPTSEVCKSVAACENSLVCGKPQTYYFPEKKNYFTFAPVPNQILKYIDAYAQANLPKRPCVDDEGEIDPECQCRASNTCYKMQTEKFPMEVMNQTGPKYLATFTQNFLSGETELENLDRKKVGAAHKQVVAMIDQSTAYLREIQKEKKQDPIPNLGKMAEDRAVKRMKLMEQSKDEILNFNKNTKGTQSSISEMQETIKKRKTPKEILNQLAIESMKVKTDKKTKMAMKDVAKEVKEAKFDDGVQYFEDTFVKKKELSIFKILSVRYKFKQNAGLLQP